jgi:hypothetical protein
LKWSGFRKAGEPEPNEGEAGDVAEGDDGVDPEDAADREEADPLPMQGIEIPAVIQFNGAEGAQLPPPDGDLFGYGHRVDRPRTRLRWQVKRSDLRVGPSSQRAT